MIQVKKAVVHSLPRVFGETEEDKENGINRLDLGLAVISAGFSIGAVGFNPIGFNQWFSKTEQHWQRLILLKEFLVYKRRMQKPF